MQKQSLCELCRSLEGEAISSSQSLRKVFTEDIIFRLLKLSNPQETEKRGGGGSAGREHSTSNGATCRGSCPALLVTGVRSRTRGERQGEAVRPARERPPVFHAKKFGLYSESSGSRRSMRARRDA